MIEQSDNLRSRSDFSGPPNHRLVGEAADRGNLVVRLTHNAAADEVQDVVCILESEEEVAIVAVDVPGKLASGSRAFLDILFLTCRACKCHPFHFFLRHGR